MIALACFLIALVAGVALTRRRPLAELVVDMLYRRALRAYALACAVDSGLCRYRRVVDETRAGHEPMYLGVAR